MSEFHPKDPNQAHYFADTNRVMLDVGDSVDVVLDDGDGLIVAVDDPAISVSETSQGPRTFAVKGVTAFGGGFLTAKNDRADVLASMMIGVGPVNAAFDPPTATVDVNGTVDVTLNHGVGLEVKIVGGSAAAKITETGTPTADARTFRVTGLLSSSHANFGASAPNGSDLQGGVYAFLSIAINAGPTVAPATSAAPANTGAVTAPLGDVPAELLAAGDAGSLPLTAKSTIWTPDQAKLILTYFLHAVKVMRSHSMPLRSSLLLVAQTGLETSYGARGPNPAHKNYLSFQPPPAQADTLKKAGVPIVTEDRINTAGGHPQATPVPDYKDIDQSITIQIEIVLPQLYPGLLTSLNGPKTRPDEYAAVADAAKYSGVPYTRAPGADPKLVTSLPDEFDRCSRFIKTTMKSLPSSFSEETRTWAQRLVLQL